MGAAKNWVKTLEIADLVVYRLAIPMDIQKIKKAFLVGAVMTVFLFGAPLAINAEETIETETASLEEAAQVPGLVTVLEESLSELDDRLERYVELREASDSFFDRFKLFWFRQTLETQLREIELYIEAAWAREFIDADTANSLNEYIQEADAIIG